MSLDSRYVLAQDLWELFTNKDTGEFLRNGYILFYKDASRTVGKPVYRLTGSAPNYSYIEYGSYDNDGAWRVDLNNQGAYSYNLYYFPYDENNELELYFVQAYSSDAETPGVFQFSREAIPNLATGEGEEDVGYNYISNGQFLLHTDLPETEDYVEGEIRAPITDIAYGGWTFERPVDSTSTDVITFERYGSWNASPESNPRYALRVRCTSPGSGDIFKDIRLTFPNVNRFSSATQFYTYGFTANVDVGSDELVELILLKNFGTGGSSTTETSLKQFTITATETVFYNPFILGTNINKTIGDLDDDYIQIIIRLPLDSTFDILFTDEIFSKGALISPGFPETTNREMIQSAIGGGFPVPKYDGSNLYLTPRLTKNGWVYDDSEIGNAELQSQLSVFVNSLHPSTNLMLPDGERYETREYSPLGIPYSRLQSKYWDPDFNAPFYGTGPNYSISYKNAIPAYIRLTQNTKGEVTDIADGSAPTGYTFATIHEGDDYSCKGLYTGTNNFYIVNNAIGSVTAANAGTSGFTVVQSRSLAATYSIVAVATLAATGLAGLYFEFSTTAANYYCWFKVGGSGSDPAVSGRTGIQIDFIGTETNADVAKIISEALNGFAIATIITLDGATTPNSSFFSFDSPGSDEFYVWYDKNNAGVDPAPSGRIPIRVPYTGSETADQISALTQIAINSKYFASPDYRDAYFKIFDQGLNPSQIRFSNNSNLYGDNIGTWQLDDILAHAHSYTLTGFSNHGFTPAPGSDLYSECFQGAASTAVSGGASNQVKNIYLNAAIRY